MFSASKIFDLLMSLYDFLQTFLQTVADTIIYKDGVGGSALSTFSYLTGLILFCLMAAFIWNVGEAVVHRAKFLGEKNAIPWKNLKNCLFILIVATTTVAANAVFTADPMGGSFMGISYPTITAGVQRGPMANALNTVAAVDVVANWEECIQEYGKDRDQKILQYIATKDPDTYATYLKATQINGDQSLSPTVMERLKFIWEGTKVVTQGVVTGSFEQLEAKAMLNLCLYGLMKLVIIILCLLFVYHAGRTIILLAFYVQFSALLSMIVLPAAIGLLYFERMRHAGIAVIKQVVVLMLVAGVMSGAVTAVFSSTNIKTAMTIAMKGELAPYANKITDNDVIAFKAKTLASLESSIVADIAQSPSYAAAMTMSIQENFASSIAVIKIMFILGTMLMVIGKLFDLVNGALGEFWDPLAEGARAAG